MGDGGARGATARAQSTLVGTILLLAVTVTLASVVGGAALYSTADKPTRHYFQGRVSHNADTITLLHAGGDTIPTADLVFRLHNATVDRTHSFANTTVHVGDGNTVFQPGERATFRTNLTGPATLLLVDTRSRQVLYRATVDLPRHTENGTTTPSKATQSTNHDPTASFTYHWDGSSDNVKLDASGSSDPDGNSLTYHWDVGNNGAFEKTTTKELWNTNNLHSGTTVRLRVTDGNGGSAEIMKTLHRTDGNQPLKAAFTMTKRENGRYSLDASASTVPESQQASYDWKIWSKRSNYSQTENGKHVESVWLRQGWTVTLTVTSGGQRSTTSDTVPIASFTASRHGDSGRVDLNASKSFDGDGDGLTYRWYVSDQQYERNVRYGTQYSSGPWHNDKQYSNDPRYTGERVKNADIRRGATVRLVVTDGHGAQDSASKRIGRGCDSKSNGDGGWLQSCSTGGPSN